MVPRSAPGCSGDTGDGGRVEGGGFEFCRGPRPGARRVQRVQLRNNGELSW